MGSGSMWPPYRTTSTGVCCENVPTAPATLQTLPLTEKIQSGRLDAVFGGGRRDEEKARAKERVFSLRDEFSRWDPRRQRPELWNLYNGRHAPGEHVRVFPLSNWAELDVWQCMAREHRAWSSCDRPRLSRGPQDPSVSRGLGASVRPVRGRRLPARYGVGQTTPGPS